MASAKDASCAVLLAAGSGALAIAVETLRHAYRQVRDGGSIGEIGTVDLLDDVSDLAKRAEGLRARIEARARLVLESDRQEKGTPP